MKTIHYDYQVFDVSDFYPIELSHVSMLKYFLLLKKYGMEEDKCCWR